MKAMLLKKIAPVKESSHPLELVDVPDPRPAVGEVLLRVSACGVCHTELDEIEGRTPPATLPMILGHQVVGQVIENRGERQHFRPGERVGVAWIFSACGVCEYCQSGHENLCADFKATGRDAIGGYAELMCAPEAFVHPIPDVFSDVEAAPLLCAGAIGYRSLRLAELQDGQNLGLSGFGASAHLMLKLSQVMYPNSKIYVFSRSEGEQAFARELGAAWAGRFQDQAPAPLQRIIDTTPVWLPVVEALRSLAPGGRLVINAIRKESIDQDVFLKLSYPEHLWMEKEIKSVANVTRRDVQEFLELASRIPLHPEVQTYALEDANQALVELKTRKIRGAKVLSLGG